MKAPLGPRFSIALLAVFLPAGSLAADPLALPSLLGDLRPGKTVEVPPRIYTTQGHLDIRDVRGTAENPVVIRAVERGKTIVRGHAGFALRACEHVVIEGFVFENDANQQGVLLENCRHVRITRCTFRLSEKEKPRWGQYWLYVIGRRSGHNRIDHNLFERQKNRGSMVFIRGDDATLTPSQHDRVDHNHFRDVLSAGNANGHETLRTGSNDLGAAGRSTFTVIEHNLLERCSGEQEIVSLKSSENIVRHNTFVDCRGCICLRLGHRSQVHDNIMLNPGRVAGAGGVKVYGVEHRIARNYFSGLTGTGHESPLVLVPATMETETTDQLGAAYQDFTTTAPTRVAIEQNTWIDCATLRFGDLKPNQAHPFTPKDCIFTHNTVLHTQPLKIPLVRLGLVRALHAQDNIAFSAHAKREEPWASWFQWASEAPPAKPPKPIKAADVGPDAPEHP